MWAKVLLLKSKFKETAGVTETLLDCETQLVVFDAIIDALMLFITPPIDEANEEVGPFKFELPELFDVFDATLLLLLLFDAFDVFDATFG